MCCYAALPSTHMAHALLYRELGDCGVPGALWLAGVGDGELCVCGTGGNKSVPLSKSPNCSLDLLELLFWCQRLLLAQLHACTKWLWSCPRGLSRVGIRVAFGWLVCLSFLDAIAFFSLSQFCMGLWVPAEVSNKICMVASFSSKQS